MSVPAGPGAPSGKMRVLAVEHTGGIKPFRGKWEWLSRYPDVDLTVLAPRTWIENYRLVRTDTAASGYRIRTGRVAWRGYENRGFFYTGLAGALRAIRPDILHLVEEPYSLFALQSTLLARALCPRAKILFYSFDNLSEGFRYSCRPSAAYALIARTVQRRTDCGVVGCTDSGTILRSHGFSRPLRFVPLGLDPERFHPRDPGGRRGERGLRGLVIGLAGRLLPGKGIPCLAEAMTRLRGERTLLVLGEGPEREQLHARAAAGGWGESLRIMDMVPHADVPDWLNLMDLLVLPSITLPRFKEQFGRVLIEAMACGVPVIGSSSGSIPEVIGDAGLVFPEGDAGALVEAIERVRTDADLRRRLIAAGLERVRRFFTWERVAAQYKEIYDGLVAGTLASETSPAWASGAPR